MGNTLLAIEIVEDRTSQGTCDRGYLTLKRLLVRNRYGDGSVSEPYPCDVLHRPGSDAVVAVLYELDDQGRIQVLLREAPRVPIYLRKDSKFVHPDPREYLTILEVVAGMVEESDPPGLAGMQKRAAAEAEEEAGATVPESHFQMLGGETFASPGTGDEKLYFTVAPTELQHANGGDGDGSTMEEWGQILRMELGEALRRTRTGEIPDMKTEVALTRLADHLGYIPQLGCFARDLPEEYRTRYDPLGVESRTNKP
ncbi:MAG: NUDIX hydrolase [Planctomycetota bacterium]|nr:NUDIX hydrolase [Planctomycetota bacterium]